MSAAEHFMKTCEDKIKENIKFTLERLSDPASFVQVDASESLKQAAKGNFGPLASVAGDYLEQNSDALLLQALKVTGLENSALDALNLFYNMLAQAISAYNDLILLFLKKIAQNIIVELEAKEIVNQSLKQSLTNLHNGLLAISSGDPVFSKYIKDLRGALVELDSGYRDILFVRNTLDKTSRFLGKQYKTGRSKIDDALDKIKPLDDNPYLSPTFKGVLANVGIQTDLQQINNILAIPRLCKDVIGNINEYSNRVTKINTMLVFYYAGLRQLQTGIPDLIKKYILSRFDSTLSKLSSLVKSMALTLNGSETSVARASPGFTPQPLPVSVLAFKWAMDGTLVRESFKLLPTGHVVVERRANAVAPGAAAFATQGRTFIGASSDEFKSVQIGDTVAIFNTSRAGEYKVKSVVSGQELELDRVVNSTNLQINGVDYQITSDALGALQLNFEAVDAYAGSVKKLKRMGTISNGKASLIATEAQEDSRVFPGQLLTFLLEATAAAVSAKIRPAALLLCKSFINRCDLVTARDRDIRITLQAFINTPIPLEETLKRLQDGLMKALRGMGLDRAADLLESGDFAGFFKLNGKNATYVGAALEAIAFLKDCFDNDADRNKLSEIENNVKGDGELLNFRISFNFDLAIFKNLKDCLNLNALSSLFSTKEILCGLLKEAGVGTLFNKLNDLLSF